MTDGLDDVIELNVGGLVLPTENTKCVLKVIVLGFSSYLLWVVFKLKWAIEQTIRGIRFNVFFGFFLFPNMA